MAEMVKSICLQCGRPRFDPWVRKISWRRKWQPTPVFLPGKSHGQRNLVGYNIVHEVAESDMTEQLHFTSVVDNITTNVGPSIASFFLNKALVLFRNPGPPHAIQAIQGKYTA